MKRLSVYIIFFLFTTGYIPAQQADSLFAYNDSFQMIKHPWRAAFHATGYNAAVWAFDWFAMNEGYAKVTLRSLDRNVTNGFVWDNDNFSTNLLAHPYVGSLYFNSARSNNLSFWQSVPYSFGGSLMWEIFAESEPPAINDFLATSLGGVALGEVTYRLSSLILDDSRNGIERFFREFMGTLISPARGINRLINGDAWKVRRKYFKHHNYYKLPVKISVTLGDRYMVDNNSLFRENNSPYVEFDVIYGDPLQKNTNQPFDYFKFNSVFNLDGSQPVVGSINLTAKLFGKYLEPVPGHKMLVGIFQHFDFFDSGLIIEDSKKIPFKISEAAAFGLGMVYQFPTTNKVTIRQSSFFNAILLGGSLSDYYNVIDRNYNMGSGYSVKSNTFIDFGRYGNFELNLMNYRIFTWKGYEGKDLKKINLLYLNAQGDKSKVQLTVINPMVNINLDPQIKINLGLYYYLRNTNYVYHEDIFFRTFEVRLGLKCSF